MTQEILEDIQRAERKYNIQQNITTAIIIIMIIAVIFWAVYVFSIKGG